LPRGAITEIVGRISSGRTTLGYTLLASATRAGESVAWVDLPNAFDPESLSEAGANLGHVLWLQPRDRQGAIRAVEHVLDAGGFRLVVLDLDGASPRPCVPMSSWLRITRAAVHRDAAIVVLGSSGLAGSCAALSLEVRSLRRVFDGESGPYSMFEGAAIALFLRRRKFGPTTDAIIDLFASACG
jgi:hypothetical protein